MRPLMTRFCVYYSLQVGVVALCVVSMLVSGGLILNHRLILPNQIRDWRNATIYTKDKLDILDLNDNIATWVLVGDILLTVVVLIPTALSDRETPWEKRNCVRKILIPCFTGKILSIVYNIVAFVWILLNLHTGCSEIIGILIALMLHVLLGWYFVVVVISYYLELGLRWTFHKLRPSVQSSAARSQNSSASFQTEETGRSNEKISRKKKAEDIEDKVSREEINAVGFSNKLYENGDKREYKSSNKSLDKKDEKDGKKKKKYSKTENMSHSSQEIVAKKKFPSKEVLSKAEKEIADREEQYNKLLGKSTIVVDSEDGKKADTEKTKGNLEAKKKEKRYTPLGPDKKNYRVSEKADGDAKRRYYYKTKPSRESDDSYESPERKVSGKGYGSPRQESDGSYDSERRHREPSSRNQRHGSEDSHDGYLRSRPIPPRYADHQELEETRGRTKQPQSRSPRRTSDGSPERYDRHPSQRYRSPQDDFDDNKGNTRHPLPRRQEREFDDYQDERRPSQSPYRDPYDRRMRYDDEDNEDHLEEVVHTRSDRREDDYRKLAARHEERKPEDRNSYDDRRYEDDYDDEAPPYRDTNAPPYRHTNAPPYKDTNAPPYRDTIDEDGYVSSEV